MGCTGAGAGGVDGLAGGSFTTALSGGRRIIGRDKGASKAYAGWELFISSAGGGEGLLGKKSFTSARRRDK